MTDWPPALFGSGFLSPGTQDQSGLGSAWLRTASDGLTVLAYFAIALTLLYLVRKQTDAQRRTLIFGFCTFLLACGAAQLLEMWSFWHADQRLPGLFKALTAILAFVAAMVLLRRIPAALEQPGPTEMARQNETLEQRVRARTSDLNAVNDRLRRSEQQLALALDGADIGLWDWHVPTQRCVFDQRWRTMLGYTAEEVESNYSGWERLVHPDDMAPTLAILNEHLAGRTPQYEAVYRMRTRAGDWKWILDRGKVMERDAAGLPIRAVGTHLDITQRKEAELALHGERERMHSIFQGVSEGIVMHDRDGRIVECNPAAEKILGVTRARMIGTGPLDWAMPNVHEDGSPWTRSEHPAMVTLRTGASLRECGIGVVREDAGVLWLSLNTEPIPGADGRPVACVVSFTDISERKRMDADKERIQAKLLETQKLESLGVLAGGIAHDFNNLLTGVIGNVGLARFDLPPHSPVEHCLTQIEQSAVRAADLCKQMLAYSGKGRFVIELLDLNTAIKDTANLLQVSINKKASLHLALAPALPAISADAAQIQQVIMNLVANAAEAIGDRPGHITVATGTVEADGAYLGKAHGESNLPPGPYVWLEVRDDGTGIKPDQIGKIFDPFFTTKFTGRGLGLAAVLGIVRGHQGAIKVDSELGRGSAFRILFPPATGTVSPVRSEMPSTRVWRGQGEVLVIDDEETVRLTAAGLLRAVGFTPTIAADGREGLAAFQMGADRFSVVLLDLTMPGMDGEEVFRRLRQIRGDVRVVLMSGFNKVQAVDRFSGKGLAGFVQKPFTLDALAAVMRRAFESAPPF